MALTELIIPPDQAAYSVRDGEETIATKLQGGAPRYRLDILGATSRVTVQWTVGPEFFRYLRAFYRGQTLSGSLPFNIKLLLDNPELTLHKAYFVPNSFALRSQSGLRYTVVAELEVYPAPITDSLAGFVQVMNGFGEDWKLDEERINTEVNTTMPGFISLEVARRMNRFLYSEQLDNAVWNKADLVIGANAINGPTGYLTADKLKPAATNAVHRIHQVVAAPLGSAYVMSFFGKAGELQFIQWSNDLNTATVNFDLSTGQKSVSGIVTATSKEVADGWYRYTITTPFTTLGNQYLTIVPALGSARQQAFLGNGTSGLYVTMLQLEEAATVGEYKVTTGTEVDYEEYVPSGL